jgi:hypothetical protein
VTLRRWGLAVALAALAGCSKCGKKAELSTGVERALPRNAVAVVVVPSKILPPTKAVQSGHGGRLLIGSPPQPKRVNHRQRRRRTLDRYHRAEAGAKSGPVDAAQCSVDLEEDPGGGAGGPVPYPDTRAGGQQHQEYEKLVVR